MLPSTTCLKWKRTGGDRNGHGGQLVVLSSPSPSQSLPCLTVGLHVAAQLTGYGYGYRLKMGAVTKLYNAMFFMSEDIEQNNFITSS